MIQLYQGMTFNRTCIVGAAFVRDIVGKIHRYQVNMKITYLGGSKSKVQILWLSYYRIWMAKDFIPILSKPEYHRIKASWRWIGPDEAELIWKSTFRD